MSDELAKKDETKLALPNVNELESIDGFEFNDLRLSSFMICQAQSNKAIDNGVVPGMIYDNMTYEAFEKIELITFYKFDTRILYGENVGDNLRCYSQDAKIPSHPLPINNNCYQCPENVKPPEMLEKGSSKYGDCNRTFNFACVPVSVETGSEKDFPFLIPMQRTNAPIAKNIINLSIRKRQELFAVKRILSTEEIKGEKGRYYIYNIKTLDSVSENDLERSRYWLKFIKGMLKAQKLIIDFEQQDESQQQGIPF